MVSVEADTCSEAGIAKSPGGGSNVPSVDRDEEPCQCGALLCARAVCFWPHAVPSAFGTGQTCAYLQVSPLPHFDRFHLMHMPLPWCLRNQDSCQSFKWVPFLMGGEVVVFLGATALSPFLGVPTGCCTRGRGCKADCMSCLQWAISLIVSLRDQLLSRIAVVTAIQTALSAANTSCRLGALNDESQGAANASSLNL